MDFKQLLSHHHQYHSNKTKNQQMLISLFICWQVLCPFLHLLLYINLRILIWTFVLSLVYWLSQKVHLSFCNILHYEKNLAFFTLLYLWNSSTFLHIASLFLLLAPLYGYTTIYILIMLVLDIGFFLFWIILSSTAMDIFCIF